MANIKSKKSNPVKKLIFFAKPGSSVIRNSINKFKILLSGRRLTAWNPCFKTNCHEVYPMDILPDIYHCILYLGIDAFVVNSFIILFK